MPEPGPAAETDSHEPATGRLDVRDLLGAVPADDGSKVALIHEGRQIRYEELRSEVERLAGGLRDNIRAGELLGIWLPNCPDLLCLYLACLKTGIVPMPLHQGMKWLEVREVLIHSKAKWLVTSRETADPHAVELSGVGLSRIYVIDREPPAAPVLSHCYTELKGSGSTGAPSAEQRGDIDQDRTVSARRQDSQLALVLHTSGSNGRAKGVMLSHANIDHILRYRLAHTKLARDSVSIVASCLTQSVGIYQSLALLAARGTIVLLGSYDAGEMADSVNRHEPTHLIMVVDAFDRLLHHPSISANSFRRLAFASTGADRVTARVQDRFMALTGKPLRVSYGLTESSWALINEGERADKCLALGRPCPGIAVKLLDSRGREVAVGETGEICIKSPRTMLGYLHDEEQAREAFAEGGWLKSGDLAYQDQDGDFWFAGRKKHMIVLGSGDNVSPVEVENAILSHPAVSHCAVVGIPTPHGSEVPWAAVTRRDEMLSAAILEEFLRERISDYKIPHRIVFVPALPVGMTGKMQREEARRVIGLMA